MKKAILPLVILTSLLASCGQEKSIKSAPTASENSVDFSNQSFLKSNNTNQISELLTSEGGVKIQFSNGKTFSYENIGNVSVIDGDEGIGQKNDIAEQVIIYEAKGLKNQNVKLTPDLEAKANKITAQSASGVAGTSCSFAIFVWCVNSSSPNPELRWLNGVTYKFSSNLSQDEKNTIQAAINDWNSRVAKPKFTPITSNPNASKVLVIDTAESTKYCGLSEGIGSNSNSVQSVKIFRNPNGRSCFTRGVIQHELGHVIGLIHEHQRCNRDEYVITNTDKFCDAMTIKKEDDHTILTNNQFWQMTKYDYDSVMHYLYSPPSTPSNPTNYSLQPRYPTPADALGNPSNIGQNQWNGVGLDSNDIIGISKIYNN